MSNREGRGGGAPQPQGSSPHPAEIEKAIADTQKVVADAIRSSEEILRQQIAATERLMDEATARIQQTIARVAVPPDDS